MNEQKRPKLRKPRSADRKPAAVNHDLEKKLRVTRMETYRIDPRELKKIRDMIREEQRAKKIRRNVYLSQHRKELVPFIGEKTFERVILGGPPCDPRTKLNVVERPWFLKKGKLRDYQVEGVNWMLQMYDRGLNMVLADEMGLGKTLQTITFLAYLKFERSAIAAPSLIVVPLSVINAWCQEFQRWCPSMCVIKFHTSSKGEKERLKEKLRADPLKFDAVITTYEMLNSSGVGNIFLGHNIIWKYVVIDEGHKIKNEHSEISKTVSKIKSLGKVLLTGTPLQNNLHELWALLRYLEDDIFVDSSRFDEAFDLTHNLCNDQKLEDAHHLLRLFQLRRLKSEVEFTLPPKHEMKLMVGLTEEQKVWARKLMLRNKKLLLQIELGLRQEHEGAEDVESDEWKRLNNLFMQLRKICNHPYCLNGAEIGFDGSTDEKLVQSSGKLLVLDKLLAKLHAKGHRVVLFSQFVSVLNILEDYLNMRDWSYCRLDGSTGRTRRTLDLRVFNATGSKTFIYLMSTRAGGLGINAQTADTCILYDSDWNPQVDLQAMARVHRIGQKKKVHVYRLVTKGTVEERILQRAEKKLYLDKMVNRDSTRSSVKYEKMGKKEMLQMMKFGCAAVFGNSGKDEGGYNTGTIEYTDEELDKIIDRDTDWSTAGKEQSVADFKATQAAFDFRKIFLENEVNKTLPKKRPEKPTVVFDAGVKRKRKQTTIQIHGHAVKTANNYTMESGIQTISGSSTNGSSPDKKRKLMIAGRDYEHDDVCLICWDGGNLICCDQCSASFHVNCLKSSGYATEVLGALGKLTFQCPHHTCRRCGRKAARQAVFFYDVQNVLLHIAMNVNRRMRPFYRQESATDFETWVCLAQIRHITCSAAKAAKIS